jgi:alanine racemase
MKNELLHELYELGIKIEETIDKNNILLEVTRIKDNSVIAVIKADSFTQGFAKIFSRLCEDKETLIDNKSKYIYNKLTDL